MVTAALQAGRFHAYALIQLLIEPGLFFKELVEKTRPRRAVEFMVICCLFYALASLLTGAYSQPVWIMAPIFFINAAGMILISSTLGYMAMVMIAGKKVSFAVVFSIYAFSSGVTLFLSWLPFLVWITEPWKWWLICTGLKNTCNLSWKKSIVIVALSTIVLFFLVYSAHLAFIKNYI
ncbi:YIP1 family protein [Desulfotignum phosphitoxidans]|jgi:hypothetical protein|uniref:Yip1 domain-containing protein n=1 Tax=Desulfotignum phosphitoxidans DSM 13687 TaxID=1286635 RepID=S0G1C8_9BACT|nr:YIP1 family protein [Desulfotignum phosphitoxidans]EMS80705.1 hypothetical protein Dpo_2c04010 [Desulfotignum phosphitoxidans DSM 13687]